MPLPPSVVAAVETGEVDQVELPVVVSVRSEVTLPFVPDVSDNPASVAPFSSFRVDELDVPLAILLSPSKRLGGSDASIAGVVSAREGEEVPPLCELEFRQRQCIAAWAPCTLARPL